MSDRTFFAHTAPEPGAPWQELEEHLTAVSARAEGNAQVFGAGEWGRVAGMWHDLGKYSEAFQEYLRTASDPDVHNADALPRTDHSTAGAQHAAKRFGGLGHLIAYVIAGHHAGLADMEASGTCLRKRLLKPVEPWGAAPARILDLPSPTPPPFLLKHLGAPARREGQFGLAFFTRMLYSALVDADFLDTEAFMDPARASERGEWPEDVLRRMLDAVEAHLTGFGEPKEEVNRRRAEVAQACREASEREPGLFTLTVPTGGGKTLASLLFSLRHAQTHGLRRVVYVAPFTSIIEQNADVYRDVFRHLVDAGLPDPVVEHHSNLDPDRETDQSRRATENWAAPLVVTTAVQFYESMFANRSSRCRKLHNLARAVVVLDEAQSLPVDLLAPCLRALEALSRDYGTTVVLCTATQPAVARTESFGIGLEFGSRTEIVPDPPSLFRALKRVAVEKAGALSDEDLVDRLCQHEQVLCIVNTRRHARILAQALGDGEEHVHLSALMCPAHRTEALARVRGRLERGAPCRVVSTQLIEAGVDIDFPVVYRALAGLDAIAQAAGRCNRNGRLSQGRTIVFEVEHASSERFIADQVGSARQMLAEYEDLLAPEAVAHYFRLHYWEQKGRWDKRDILDCFRLDTSGGPMPFLFQFRTAATAFRLIDTVGVPVIIPWGDEGGALCEELRNPWTTPGVRLLRRLQRFTVQIPERVWNQHRSRSFEIAHDQYPILALPEARYSPYLGLDLEADIGSELVV